MALYLGRQKIAPVVNTIDVALADATESDVRAGKTFFSGNDELKTGTFELKLQEKTTNQNGEVVADIGYDGLSKVVVDVSSSGAIGEYLVKVIDYDGEILKQEYLNAGDTFTLPDAPTNHERLVFQEWSSAVDIIDNTVIVENQDITIGAVYTTASGLSEFDIELTKVTGLNVTLRISGTKNWGDGTIDTSTTHTYTNYGKYMITCDGSTISRVGQQTSTNPNCYITNIRLSNITSISSQAFQYCSSLRNVTIPVGITSIESYTFQYCYSLKQIIIPRGVTGIGRYASQHCYSLTNVTIPSGVTNIEERAFDSCQNLTSITLPNSVTSIEIYAFYYCMGLTGQLTIPESVTSLGGDVFEKCHNLAKVKILSNLTSFGEYRCFSYCHNLTEINIPSTITNMGNYTFENCYNLRRIDIPSAVTSIGSNLFSNCYNLMTYDFSKLVSVPTLSNTNVFRNINKAAKIIVPDALYDEWIAATNWITYADYIYKVSEV